MYIDTHAHLNFKAFKNDYKGTIERAFEAGVGVIINVGSNLETSQKAVDVADEYPSGVYASIGLHPIHVNQEEFDQAAFERLLKNPKVVAVGETGLDYYYGGAKRFRPQTGSYDKSTANVQKDLFRKHLNLALRFNKPVIFHSRDAGEDVLSILMGEKNDAKGVMHCFQGGWTFAKVILDLGLYISFTGLITFSKNYETVEVIENTPLDRLMIETDCPYMTPEPHRGQRNEPAYVIEVAKKIAEIKKIPVEEVALQTTKNAIQLFDLKSAMLS